MRGFMRQTACLLLVVAVLGAVIRIRRAVLGPPSGASAGGTIRTGSFDTWPGVSVAPGRHLPGG
jgi:hypothetical protein